MRRPSDFTLDMLVLPAALVGVLVVNVVLISIAPGNLLMLVVALVLITVVVKQVTIWATMRMLDRHAEGLTTYSSKHPVARRRRRALEKLETPGATGSMHRIEFHTPRGTRALPDFVVQERSDQRSVVVVGMVKIVASRLDDGRWLSTMSQPTQRPNTLIQTVPTTSLPRLMTAHTDALDLLAQHGVHVVPTGLRVYLDWDTETDRQHFGPMSASQRRAWVRRHAKFRRRPVLLNIEQIGPRQP